MRPLAMMLAAIAAVVLLVVLATSTGNRPALRSQVPIKGKRLT